MPWLGSNVVADSRCSTSTSVLPRSGVVNDLLCANISDEIGSYSLISADSVAGYESRFAKFRDVSIRGAQVLQIVNISAGPSQLKGARNFELLQ
ncbi:hypothetical protein EMCRGX_G016463 [Ephydatia muelleri]